MKIYVGNLSYQTTEDDLGQLFDTYGEVASVNIVTDRFSGESRGFGFVEMPAKNEAINAMKELTGKDFKGRELIINEARPQNNERRSGGSSGNNGRKNDYNNRF